MHQHLRAQHPSWEKNVMDGHELQTFRDKMKITIEEEKKLDIPEDRWGLWHIVGQNTSTDVRHANPLYLPSIRDGHGDSPRRKKRTIDIYFFHT